MIFSRACLLFASYPRKIIKNLQFVVHIKIFPKNTFFALPPLTLRSSVTQTPMYENSVPGRVFGSRRDPLRKIFEVRRIPQKFM